MGKEKSPRRVADNEALAVGTQIRGSAQKLNLVAQLIRGRWERLRDSGAFASGVDPEASTQTWHWATIATVAALGAATVIGSVV